MKSKDPGKIKRIMTIIISAVLLVNMAAPFFAYSPEDGIPYVVYITGHDVNLRSGPGTENELVASAIKYSSEFEYISEAQDSAGDVWYEVVYESGSAWVSGKYSTKLGRSQAYIQNYIDLVSQYYGAVGVQAVYIDSGTAAQTYSYGYATKETDPMIPETKIRLASLSKVFLVMEALKLQEQGVISLEDRLDKYWTEPFARKITFRDAFTHTSSIVPQDYAGSLDGTLALLQNEKNYMEYGVGTAESWKYNNFAIGVAGTSLELALGSSLDAYAFSQFFMPMGIEGSWYSGCVNSDHLATLYAPDGSVQRTIAESQKIDGSGGTGKNTAYFAGGLTMSVGDYARLFSIIINDGMYDGTRYLSADSISLMEQCAFPEITEKTWGFDQCMPLRFKKELYGENSLFYHTGNAYGVLALASYNPDSRNGVVVVTNGAKDDRDAQGIYSICGRITDFMYSAARYTPSAQPMSDSDVAPAMPVMPGSSGSSSGSGCGRNRIKH